VLLSVARSGVSERLWCSLKHEDVFLKGYADGREARAGIASWISYYNARRPHQAHGGRTPMAGWRAGTTGELDGRAVDMMDNAVALPTCPQRQQPQKSFAMVRMKTRAREGPSYRASNQQTGPAGTADGVQFRFFRASSR